MLTRYLELPDGKIAYDDQGSGPLVLCMPAGGDLRSEYRFLTPRLVAAGYRVVTMDIRGHGDSSIDWPEYTASALGADMVALLRRLDGGPAVIIGTSKAVAAAVWAAVEAPELVERLVLIAGFARPLPAWQARLMTGVLLAPWWGAALYGAYFPKMYPSARPADFTDHLNKVKAMLRQPGRLRALRLLFADTGAEAFARMARVEQPVLVLMGSRDPDVRRPDREAALIAAQLRASQAEVRLIEGAGHHPQAEMPGPVAEAILAFLGEVEPAAASGLNLTPQPPSLRGKGEQVTPPFPRREGGAGGLG